MYTKLGTKPGMLRDATIIRYNGDGTVRIALNEGPNPGVRHEYDVSIPSAWSGPNGEFIGGYPPPNSTVSAVQGQGGQWFIVDYINSRGNFDSDFLSVGTTRMEALKPGRALIQVSGGTRLFADPQIGIQAGNANNFIHINPIRNIISHNFEKQFSFTEAGFALSQVTRRDLVENSTRNILGSTLTSHSYENSLFSIGLDPTLKVKPVSRGEDIRNPAYVEVRELINEFGASFDYKTDREESAAYNNNSAREPDPRVNKRDMRSNLLSLSLEHPNHLIESVKGTLIDATGNILDLNRVILPIGRSESLSLKDNPNKSEAHDKIRAVSRKSVAYHFEINTRKGGVATSPPEDPPNINNKNDYARLRSKFFLDIDKEGQFKLNVPASSEIGNIGLLTRYENYSNLLANEDNNVDPNSFILNEDRQDIFLENFATNPGISLTPGERDKSEYGQAVDRFSSEPIKLGTAFHDITKVVSEFQESANYLAAGLDLVQFDPSHPLNSTDVPLEKIVTDEIIVNGPDANAGGRSGTISLDGSLSLNIGANTVDRQSLWLDTAGGVVGSIGRDRQGVSAAISMDGDVLVQIGGPGLGNKSDSRFESENDAYRNGKLDIRVLQNGQLLIFRMDETGINVISPGRMSFWSQQEMIFKSNTNILMEAESIIMYAETSKRIINRFPPETIG